MIISWSRLPTGQLRARSTPLFLPWNHGRQRQLFSNVALPRERRERRTPVRPVQRRSGRRSSSAPMFHRNLYLYLILSLVIRKSLAFSRMGRWSSASARPYSWLSSGGTLHLSRRKPNIVKRLLFSGLRKPFALFAVEPSKYRNRGDVSQFGSHWWSLWPQPIHCWNVYRNRCPALTVGITGGRRSNRMPSAYYNYFYYNIIAICQRG